MKIAVVCSPEFEDKGQLDEVVSKITKKEGNKKVVILCRPCDELVQQWAYKKWHTVMLYHPDIKNWKEEMLSLAEGLVAFWGGDDDVEELMDMAKATKKKLKVVMV